LMHHSIFAFKKNPDDTHLDFFGHLLFIKLNLCY